jgi:hypothetical protein
MKRRDMMRRAVAMLAMPGMAIAQPAKKPARVGWLGLLGDTWLNPSDALEALRSALAAMLGRAQAKRKDRRAFAGAIA